MSEVVAFIRRSQPQNDQNIGPAGTNVVSFPQPAKSSTGTIENAEMNAAQSMARVRASVKRMEDNYAEARVNIAIWRNSTQRLQGATKVLENTLLNYQRNLAKINVKRLRRRSLRLAAILDNYLESNG